MLPSTLNFAEMKLTCASSPTQVECATTVGSNGVWFASGNSYLAQVTVMQCMTHCPLILERFMVDSSRIMAIKFLTPLPPPPVPHPSPETVLWIPTPWTQIYPLCEWERSVGSKCLR